MAAITSCLHFLNLFALFTLVIGRIRLEDVISEEDLQKFRNIEKIVEMKELDPANRLSYIQVTNNEGSNDTICLGSKLLHQVLTWIYGQPVDTPIKIQTSFIFYSRNRPGGVQVQSKETLQFGPVDFSRERTSVILIHGFMSYSKATWLQEMTEAFLEWGNLNVIVVDWSQGGSTWKYWQAVALVRHVGSEVAGLFRRLKTEMGADVKKVHCVGHSLGAHICGFMSIDLGKVGRITGLDPAQPCFKTKDDNQRLSRYDADYVDVIHTNAAHFERLGLGYPYPLGTSDFYPNAGSTQPGCDNWEYESNWIGDFKLGWLREAVCSHGRAYEYFIQSLKFANSSQCRFKAVPWSPDQPSTTPNPQTPCDDRWCPEMGINAIGSVGRLRAEGTFYVSTIDKEPFCRYKNGSAVALRSRAPNCGVGMPVYTVFIILVLILAELLRGINENYEYLFWI